MKPYLVDVPVKVNIWIRPECQRKQFEVLKQARPSILFLQSDGGRNEKEWEAIYLNRQIFETEVDWDCTIHKIYEDKNLGLYAMGRKTSQYIWERVDRCIFLEDDHIPAVSFFQFCAELLEKYKDDLRISCICGMNQLGIYEDASADYFFSRQGSIWGVGQWKRSIDMRDREFAYGKDPYVMKLLKQRAKHNPIFLKRAQAYAKQEYYEGHVAGGEFYIEFAMYGHNQVQIVPKKNMISCIGATENSAHAQSLHRMSRGIRQVFNSKTYELEFPLQHPSYVIPDVNYEKKRNRIMAYNCPWIKFSRKIESIVLALLNGELLATIKKRIKRRGVVEK